VIKIQSIRRLKVKRYDNLLGTKKTGNQIFLCFILKDEERLKFTLDLAPDTPKGPSGVASPLTPAKTPKEETEDWKLFQVNADLVS
jgi:hypothetical protein